MNQSQQTKPSPAPSSLLTIQDVAAHLQVSSHTVRRWLRTGELRGYKIGRGWRVAPEELRSWIAAHAHSLDGAPAAAPAEGQA